MRLRTRPRAVSHESHRGVIVGYFTKITMVLLVFSVLWRVADGALLQTLQLQGLTRRIVFSPDSQIAVTSTDANMARVWRVSLTSPKVPSPLAIM